MTRKTYEERKSVSDSLKIYESEQRKKIFKQIASDLTKKQKRRIKLRRRRLLKKRLRNQKQTILENVKHEQRK